ncbi:protein FAM110C [Mustelus asterias]
MPTDISQIARLQPGVSPSLPLRILNKGPGYLRRQMGESSSRGRLSAVERLAADRDKYVKSRPAGVGAAAAGGFGSSGASEEEGGGSSSAESGGSGEKAAAAGGSPGSGHLSRPLSERSRRSKRQLRPDSLVIYRQKCEFGKGSGGGGGGRANPSLVRRLIQGSGLRDKQPASPEVPKVIIKEAAAAAPGQGPAEPGCRRRGGALHRSQSDISCRFSKAFSEFDTFFTYCGLEAQVIEELGRENFTSASDSLALRLRSVSVPGSDSDFSRHSGDKERLLEEALSERTPAPGSGLSVIERNARVIKWLYGCKRAREAQAAELV